jgi:hypothetical protein
MPLEAEKRHRADFGERPLLEVEPMAPEIPLENQRPAAYVHSLHVEREIQRIKKTEV